MDVFSIWVTGEYFSPIGPRPHGPCSYLEEDAIPCVHAKPRKASEWTPLNLIRFFALEPLVGYGFNRFRNLLKVEVKTIQQICLGHLGYSPKICLLAGKSGVPKICPPETIISVYRKPTDKPTFRLEAC